jgi:hypothetical protein
MIWRSSLTRYFEYQAFLEMEDEDSAVGMVDYFTNCTATLRDRSVYVQFSTHSQLRTDQVSTPKKLFFSSLNM